ncbi:MAG TPA: hypothetical protein PKC23_01410 [Candidatus Desulfobacillus sp.]|nr:hypothetical protein [Candidatus Desulfobacillus sp.]
MLDSVFTGWGAFWAVIAMFAPFALMGIYIVRRKSVSDTGPSPLQPSEFIPLEGVWLTFAFIFFVIVNLAGLKFIPWAAAAPSLTAEPAEPITQAIDFTAKSWAYDLSSRQIEAGKPVRFSGRSSDTQHGFAVYHPDGRMLFTMLMMPNTTKATSVVYTFKDPGTYKVRCLEYCGIAHHAMQDELTVVKSN